MTWLTVTENLCHTDHIYVPLVVNNNQSLFNSSLITGFVSRVTRRVSLLENELLTIPDHLGLPPVLIGVRGARSMVICVLFCRTFFVLFVLSVLLWITDSHYPFVIFNLFWYARNILQNKEVIDVSSLARVVYSTLPILQGATPLWREHVSQRRNWHPFLYYMFL